MPKISGLPQDSAPTANDYIPVLDADTGILKRVLIADMASVQVPNMALSNNPYKFSVYRNAAANSPAGGSAVIQMDAELYDTSNNVDTATNKGRFTVPVAGFYHFTVRASVSGNVRIFVSIYKNGSEVKRGVDFTGSSGVSGSIVSGTVQLAASDYVEPYVYTSGSNAYETGSPRVFFDGELLSKT